MTVSGCYGGGLERGKFKNKIFRVRIRIMVRIRIRVRARIRVRITVRVMIRVSFLFRPIRESIPECAEYILVTLRSSVLKFRTNALSLLE